MRVFDNLATFPDRINFVDDNNVLVGYEYSHTMCCEHTLWGFSRESVLDIGDVESFEERTNQHFDVEDYSFDKAHFAEYEHSHEDSHLRNLRLVEFRLTNTKGEELFLTFGNMQTGYYSHGFDMRVGQSIVRDGYL